MGKYLKILIKWLPSVISITKELLKLAREYRQHRIQMSKLKKELEPDQKAIKGSGSVGIPEREPD